METVRVRPGTKLEQLLKIAGIVSTGGEAKLEIQSGSVTVNGRTETRRGYKVKDGDVVAIGAEAINVMVEEEAKE